MTRAATLLHRPHEHDDGPCDSPLAKVSRTETDDWAATCLRTGEEVTWPAT